MDNRYVKLKDLDGDIFTIERVTGHKFAMWDQASNKVLTADKPTKGYQKRWMIDTDRGRLEVSQAQFSKLLECVYKDGVADLNNKTISVKWNGKEKLESDYWFNLVHRETIEEPDQYGGY